MNIIALETSTRRGSVALLEDGRVLAMRQLPEDQRTAQVLAPVIRDALHATGWEPAALGLVATTNGPGSFTGLRIAVTAAKTLAYATGAQLIALNTLDVIVTQLPAEVETAGVVMNAQRGQWFASVYRRDVSHLWQCVQECQVVDREEWVQTLPSGTVIIGPTADRLEGQIPLHVQLADHTLWTPRADSLGHLAWSRFQQGLRSDPWTLVPNYYRPSYAEEKR